MAARRERPRSRPAIAAVRTVREALPLGDFAIVIFCCFSDASARLHAEALRHVAVGNRQ
jgi:hypothetical protein